MKKTLKMLAFDFGASSGRAILGQFDGEKLDINEIHRFPNEPVEINGSLFWDVLRLFHEVKQGLHKCVLAGHTDIDSIAVDTWGVDFALLDAQGNLLGNPYHYRDSNTEGVMGELYKTIQGEELYMMTGIQHMRFNTIYQLFSMKQRNLPAFEKAETMLLTPDLFNYFLSGTKKAEVSIASTTQLLDPFTGNWSSDIIERLGLPSKIFQEIIPSGAVIGRLTKALSEELGIKRASIVATASHDTQSAIACVPAEGSDFAYISCGTWSLMGIESEKPIINVKSNKFAFTNEKGINGKTTFLKNIMGLWLVQECKRHWDWEGGRISFAELENMANEAEPFVNFIDPENEVFMAPGDMPQRIRDYCSHTGQKVPQSKGEIIRCIYQSIAFKYRSTVEMLEDISGRKLDVIHMVGGGIKDKTLCSFTADATGRKVFAGPVEATSAGNLMVQAMALGGVKDLAEIRKVIKKSFEPEVYLPSDNANWDASFEKYKKLTSFE